MKTIPENVTCIKSVYLVSKETFIRRVCFNLQQHKYFDRFIMTLIFFSSIKLATDTYMKDVPEDS